MMCDIPAAAALTANSPALMAAAPRLDGSPSTFGSGMVNSCSVHTRLDNVK